VKTVVQPCFWMRTLLTRFADGNLRGLVRLYVDAHTRSCPKCRQAYEALLALRDRFAALRRQPEEGLSQQAWEALQAHIDTQERR